MVQDTLTINSIKIPRMGFGTYKLTGDTGTKAISLALQTGYRHIDTAQMYKNEEEVGKAIRNSGISRDEVFITTKVWPSDFDNVVGKVEESLRKLQVDRIDLLLLHWPSDEESTKTATHALNIVLKEGYSRSVGVSNFNITQLETARAIAPIICNQVEYHPYLSQQKLLHYMREYDMALTAYRPLAIGKVNEDPAILAIAHKLNRTPAQVALRWLMQQDDVIAIPKATHPERIRENLHVFDFGLDDADMAAIHALARNERITDMQWGAKWG